MRAEARCRLKARLLVAEVVLPIELRRNLLEEVHKVHKDEKQAKYKIDRKSHESPITRKGSENSKEEEREIIQGETS